MKKLPFILLVFISFVLPAQEGYPGGYRQVQKTFLPREFFVGDIVELRLEILPEPGLVLSVPEVFPDNPWFLIRDIQIQERGNNFEIRILFSSFQPGIRVMPGIDLGDIRLEGIRVDTSSILDRERSEFVSTNDPLFLPKTSLYFALVIGGFLGVPLVILLFFREIRRRITGAIRAAARKRPYQKIQKVLRELDRKILNRDGNRFYTTLLDELKIYLSSRTGTRFAALTTREISEVLNSLFPQESFKGELDALFFYGDEVKFGGRDPYTAQKKDDLNRTTEVLKALEAYYRIFWFAEDRSRGK